MLLLASPPTAFADLKRKINKMKINKLNREFGKDSINQIENTNRYNINGALACLETFYYSFNNKDLDVFRKVWYDNDLVQLNNPLGGITRGTKAIADIYYRIFNGQAKVWVKFTDIVYYEVNDMIVFAGTEIGEFSTQEEIIPLQIRTSRIFCFVEEENRWFQIHHHGSIDDPELLRKYQNAVSK